MFDELLRGSKAKPTATKKQPSIKPVRRMEQIEARPLYRQRVCSARLTTSWLRRRIVRERFPMATAETNPKQEAHELIERLSTGQVIAAVGLFKAMLDPVEIALANAPLDDEPLTMEEMKALDDSREWLKDHEGIPHEQVLAELGITQEEIDNYREPQ